MGTIVNAAVILVGGLLGLLLRGGIPKRFHQTVMQGLSLCVMLIGISGAIQTQDVLCVILCCVIGAIIGEAIGIEKGLNRVGDWAQSKLGKGQSTFSQGFVTASLLYCVGAMAIVGALQDGLTGDSTQLFAKSALDGISSIFFASALGPGVLLAAVPVALYQGTITLLANVLAPILSSEVINEMSAVGGLLIMGLGLNMLEIPVKIRAGNLLPAIFLPIAYMPLAAWVNQLLAR